MRSSLTLLGKLLAWSVVYALAVVWGGEWVFDHLASRPLDMGEEVRARWVRTALAFAPFAAFALWLAIRRVANVRRGLVAGVLVSLGLWGWYYVDGLMNTGGGANIGLGLLMLVSPLPVFIASWLFARVQDPSAS